MSAQCCAGTSSGYVSPSGVEALMCDDECRCAECMTQRYQDDDHGPGCDGPYNCTCGAVD